MAGTIVVTGGAGYVGSACLRHLLNCGYEAYAYDNLSEGYHQAVPSGRLIEGDISNTELLTRILKDYGAEAVMHFAAATNVGDSVKTPEFYYRNNVLGTLSVLNAMNKAKVLRILFSSTCATYGLTQKERITEETYQSPCNPYARTKLAVEWMIRDFAEAYGLGFTLLRYFNAAGASCDGKHGEAHKPETHLIPIILQVLLGLREELFVYGNDYPTPDGTCIRDYIHIDDLAHAHELAIAATTPTTRDVFNIGTGKGSSVMEVIHACERVTNKKVPYRIVGRRSGDAPSLVADPRKLIRKLGWKPTYVEVRDVIDSAWNWHRLHPYGY